MLSLPKYEDSKQTSRWKRGTVRVHCDDQFRYGTRTFNLGKELSLCLIAQTLEWVNCTLHGTEVYLLQPALRRYA